MPGGSPSRLKLPHLSGRLLAHLQHFALVRREHPGAAEIVFRKGLGEIQLQVVQLLEKWLEEFLLALPGVREAAVTGESDAVRGEVPVAYVVCDDGVELGALEAAVRADLASFKLPRRWVRLPALPRTALGKVQKHLLAAMGA